MCEERDHLQAEMNQRVQQNTDLEEKLSEVEVGFFLYKHYSLIRNAT